MEQYRPSLKVMVLRSQLKIYLERPEARKGVWVRDQNLYGRQDLTKQDCEYIVNGSVTDTATQGRD